MGFFDSEENVDQYIKMAEGHDGSLLIGLLKERAPQGARVLELGMGPGKDLELLNQAGFAPTGSDYSEVFVERYKKGPGKYPVHRLDARTLDIEESFDVIYSNKVLHSLDEQELTQSLTRQAELLSDGGLLLHSFWIGDGSEVYEGMAVQYYRRPSFEARVPQSLRIEEFQLYKEMEDDDSFWVTLRKV